MASSFLASQSLTLTLKPYLFNNPKPNFPLKKRSISSSASSTQTVGPIQLNPSRVSLTGSTRTLTTLAAVTLTATKMLTTLGFQWSGSFGLQQVLVNSAGLAFFAAVKNQTVGPLNTPLTLVAAGLAKWLDIYSGVLMVRVLLSWFPNIPWEKQPLSAIRDLCDPYLNLFRNIIPPIFDTLDVSPLLAFAVLGTLGSILSSTRGSY